MMVHQEKIDAALWAQERDRVARFIKHLEMKGFSIAASLGVAFRLANRATMMLDLVDRVEKESDGRN